MADRHPQLAELLGGWFHQDYDLGGSDLPELVENACTVGGLAWTAALAADIRRFRAAAGPDPDAALQRAFHPDLGPAAWDMDADTWLAWLLREVERVQTSLAASPPPDPVPATRFARLRTWLRLRQWPP